MSAPRIYWDANVLLSYLNAVPERLAVIDELLRKSRAKEIELVTSSVSLAEVAFARAEKDARQLDSNVEQNIDELWAPGSPIATVEFFDLVAFDARRLIRQGIAQGWWKLEANGRDPPRHRAALRGLRVPHVRRSHPGVERPLGLPDYGAADTASGAGDGRVGMEYNSGWAEVY